MTDSASITVTNHRLRKAMTDVNDDDLKSHAKKMGDKIKSELTLHLGEILKIYPYRDKCEVKIKGTSETETCLIAHDILSEGMNVSGFPKGTVTHEKAEEVIIPSETIYGIILDVDIGGKNQKCIVSYINIDRKHTPNNAHKGEYKIQVGKNVISLTDKYININSDNLFINGLPYTEAYKPLVDYPDKEEVGNGLLEIDEKLKDYISQLENKLEIMSSKLAKLEYDTGWKPLELTNKFQNYDTVNPLKIRRVGKVVEIRGNIKNISQINDGGADEIITYIPKDYQPSSEVAKTMNNVTNGAYTWRCSIWGDEKKMTISRYGNGSSFANIPPNTRLDVFMVYIID